jgi:tetrahydromethanopterin S-methyltransferase subunit G
MSEDRTRDLSDKRPFEERLFGRLDAMEARFDAMEARFDAMEARFDAMETRFEARFAAIDARLDVIESRFDAVDGRLKSLDARVQALEARRLDTKPIWERALAEILNIKDRVENIERKFDLLTIDMMQLRGDQRRLEGLFDALSSKPA